MGYRNNERWAGGPSEDLHIPHPGLLGVTKPPG